MIEFKLNHKSGVPIYRQIIDQIRYGIASGNWKAGEQLPTVRALAVRLKVNLNTVSKAYKELEIQNVLQSQQGTGTFIGDIMVEIDEKERLSKLEDICTEFLNTAGSYGFTVEDVVSELKKREGISWPAVPKQK